MGTQETLPYKQPFLMRIDSNISWLWSASAGSRRAVVLACVTGVLGISASLAAIWLSKLLVDIATGHADGPLWLYIAATVLCMAVRIALSAVSSRQAVELDIRFRNRLRSRLFTAVMESRWTGREAMHSGDILNRMEEDVRVVSGAVCGSVPSAAATSVQLAAAVVMLASLDARLVWIVLAIMPVALLAGRRYIGRMRRLTREIRETDSRIQSHIQENIQKRTMISSMERTPDTVDTLAGLQSDLTAQVRSRTGYSLFSRVMVQSGFALGYIVVLVWCVLGLREGTVTFGMMTAFLQLVSQVQRPVVTLGRQIPLFVRSMSSVERLAEITSLPQEEQGVPLPLGDSVGVRLEHVSFSYPDGRRKVIDDFSYDFRPGSVTAVTGETGAGKSTLVRLLLALLRPCSGKVVFYGTSAQAPASPSTRCNVSYVPQGNTLVSGTVRDNLLLGDPDATETQMAEALRCAVADFVFSLPGGLDSPCGEKSEGLSEGQAQRIAIARGLLHRGSVLIMDEPTSSLDPDTAHALMANLSSYSKGKTLIVITHQHDVASFCRDSVCLSRI